MYPLLKTLHIATMVAWVGGSLALAILTIMLSLGDTTQPASVFRAIRRCWTSVTSAAMVAAWAFGLTAAQWSGALDDRWVHVKLGIAFALTAWHGAFSGLLRRLIDTPTTQISGPWMVSVLVVALGFCSAVAVAVFKPW